MNEAADVQASTPTGGGCLVELGWFLSGFILPLGSFGYYRKATQKSVAQAVLFFCVFTVSGAFLASMGIGITLLDVGNDIRQSFEDGTVPEIVIRNGVAEVNGPQPVILADFQDDTGSRIFVAIDTTGEIKQIDISRYDQGILLKERELHLLDDNGEYQILPLRELNTLFETDPIFINANTMIQGWRTFSIIMTVVIFVAAAIWNSIIRLMFLLLLALILWGIVSLFRTSIGFGPILISGIYALVPVLYAHHLFNRIGLSFFGMQTLFLIAAWLVVLFVSMAPAGIFAVERPARLWRSLFGIPFLTVLAVDLVLTFNYGDVISWALFLMTVVALLTVGIPPLIKQNEQTSPPEAPNDPV